MSRKSEDDTLRVTLTVCRRLDNRFEGLPDDSPRALELHNRRKEALHEVLDDHAEWKVEKWGLTDDEKPHEDVDLVVSLVTNPHVHAAVLSGVNWVSAELARDVLGAAVAMALDKLFKHFAQKQREQKLQSASAKLPDGTEVALDHESKAQVYPPKDLSSRSARSSKKVAPARRRS
jgi:hypothetical protein